MSEAVRLQDAAETLDHTENWAAWLLTDTITGSTWAITPAGPTLSGQSNTTTTTTTNVSGVTLGKVYEVRNTITTTAGRTGERSFVLRGARQ